MAVFATGNPGWDQGLNSLAGSLFPDPSKQAQAGYYGAETAKTLLDAQKLRYQQGKLEGLDADLAGVFGPPPQPGAAPVAPVAVPGQAPAPGPEAPPVSGPPVTGGNTGALQPPGGGVKQAPPAQSNGSPSPPIDLSRIITHAIQGGAQPEQIAHMAGAILNGMVASGRLDRTTANAMMASLGAPTAYTADVNARTQVQTTGMTVAGNLAQEKLRGQNAVTLADNEIMSVVPKGQTTAVPVTKGYIKAHPDQFDAYDSARAIAGDTPEPVTVNGQPGFKQKRDLMQPGVAPLSESTPVLMVPSGGGAARLVPPAEVRANPGAWRPAQPSDTAITGVTGPAGAMNTTGAETLNVPGVTPLPATTDQGNAQTTALLMDALRNGDLGKAQNIIHAMTQTQAAQLPKQVIRPEEEAEMQRQDLAYFANMYPPPSGYSAGTSTLPAAPRPDQLAYFSGLKRILMNGAYKNNPAAAGPVAWEMMRASGIIPKDATTDRSVGLDYTRPPLTGQAGYPNVTGGKDAEQRIYMGDEKTLPRDKQGNFDYSKLLGSLGTTPSLTDTVAPRRATPPASGTGLGKSLGSAGSLPDGPFTDSKTNKNYIVQGGQLYAAPP